MAGEQGNAAPKLPITPVRDPKFLGDNHSNTIDFKVSEF